MVASILPESYFIQRIAGDRATVSVLVGPGQSPHAYEPTPQQVASMSRALAWFTMGVEFEKGFEPKVRASWPKLPVYDATAGVEYRMMEAHGHEGEADPGEAPGGRDIHTWLGRSAAKRIAANIRDGLSRTDPAGAEAYKANCEALLKDVDSTFDSLAKDLAPLRGKTAFVYHPAFGYFLDEFGIAQEAVETGGKEPTQKVLAELIDEARKDGAKVVFVQAQFPTVAARTVADAIGGVVVPIDDLAPDWLDNLKRLGAALKEAVR